MNNLSKIHEFLNKHEWKDLLIVESTQTHDGLIPSGVRHIISKCECGYWSHRSERSTVCWTIKQTTLAGPVKAIRTALEGDKKLLENFVQFLSDINYTKDDPQNRSGIWHAKFIKNFPASSKPGCESNG